MNDSDTRPGGMPKAFALCTLAYLLAVCVAVAVGFALGGRHPILIAFVADVAATLVIYGFSQVFRNASFYDAYWSVAPVAIALYWALGAVSADAVFVRQIVVFTLVCFWAVRLTHNWARQWRGLGHEDWRYAGFRAKSGRRFWLVELWGIELMPTILVFLGCLSLYPALSAGTKPFGPLDGLALFVTAVAIVIEASADEQLRGFVQRKREPGEIMKTRLWAYSRHPNYFGEVMFWWGLFLFALAADPSYWWAVVGPVALTVLFLIVSIPMMDKRSLERRPGYEDHMRKVSALVPWFRKSE
jgi:steroid 5-alpha reductase family enzyme